MASRTKLAEAARSRRVAHRRLIQAQERLVQEQKRHARQRREQRLRMLTGVGLLAAALVAVAIAISSGSSADGLQGGKQLSQTTTQINHLLAGIPESGARLGNPDAPVTMLYYGDLECPICRDFALSSFPRLVQNDVRAGHVQVVYSAVETATRNPRTFQTQQVAALAAGRQDRFWHYVELFYHEQGQEDTGYVTESYLDALALQAAPGLDYIAWLRARRDPALARDVAAEDRAAIAAGVQGTPTVVFHGPRGKAAPSAGVPSYGQLEQAIRQVQ